MSAEPQSLTSQEIEEIQISYEEFIKHERDALKTKLKCFKDLRTSAIKQWAYKSAARMEINDQISALQRRSQIMATEIGMYEVSTKNYSKQISELMLAIKKLEKELSNEEETKVPPPSPKAAALGITPSYSSSINPMVFAAPDLFPDLEGGESFSYTSITAKKP